MRPVKSRPSSPRLTNVAPTRMRPRWWNSAMRAHVPEPHGAASTWPGPHTSALGDTPWASGSSWTSTLSTLVLPMPGPSTRSCALTAARTAIPAGDVVATRVDEEQAELRPGRHGLRHHGDQQAPVTARLQAQARPKIVEMLLEPAALVRDGRAGQAAETAREQPHPDAGGVEVDGRQHAIGTHETSRVDAMKLRCGNQVKPSV